MLGQGLTWEETAVGAVYRTLARTVSETDIVTFVNLCGFNEPLFMDMEYVARESVFGRRVAQHRVRNQRGDLVVEGRVQRMIRRRTTASGATQAP